ncbi:hypothetical protein BC829DRAFT_221221 [Chytridium lagenaria]|nr:hypothetical protein BC829DRAFT_221221 [Chytridium lagenaria]
MSFVLFRRLYSSLSIDPWLLKHNRLCPICKRDVLSMPTIPITTPPLSLEKPDASSSTSIVNERTLLITSPQDLRASEEGRSTSSSPESSRREMGWRWFFWRRSSSEESVVREETERRNQ